MIKSCIAPVPQDQKQPIASLGKDGFFASVENQSKLPFANLKAVQTAMAVFSQRKEALSLTDIVSLNQQIQDCKKMRAILEQYF